MTQSAKLTIAVTGPTGTFGFGLIPLLEAEPRVGRIVGIARRPFDPRSQGWSKMEYRQGDVRDPGALTEAFAGADVVVHLAFMITGTARAQTIRAINVQGTLNAFAAARSAGAARFVYASSVAAYGFHRDTPVGIREDWPVRPARRLFYAQEKAELEHLLEEELAREPGPELYLLRPPIVLGPHAVGAKNVLPAAVEGAAGRVPALLARLRLPVPAPRVPLQVIHEDDVGQALLLCVLGEGPPGAYNIAAEGVLTAPDLLRELGVMPVSLPARPAHLLARAATALPRPPFLPPAIDWIEAVGQPVIMDTTKAREQLGWKPRHTALDALRETVRG